MAKELQTLRENFYKNILPKMQKDHGFKNSMAVPRLAKVKINMGLGQFLAAKKDYSEVLENIAAITGQKPIVTKARKSISNFKVREGVPVAVAVTLRGDKMYDFVSKLVNITFPRVRDFRGISKRSFDGHGNYSVGINENIVFPEINPDNVDRIHGLQVTITTTAKTDEMGYELLKALGFPFREAKEKKS